MFHKLLPPNLNLWSRKRRNIGLVLLRYSVYVQEQLKSNRHLTEEDKEEMENALEQALKALELLNDGHTYNEHDPKDPLRCAKDKIEKFVPKTEQVRQTEDEDKKTRLATATKMIREITDSAAPSSTRYSVDVKLCHRSNESVNPISETLEYSFTEDSYTLDDLSYILRLRPPNPMTQSPFSYPKNQSPFAYCRPVRQHQYTHEGSMFQKKYSGQPLKALSSSGQDGIGVVYFIAPEPNFIILVRGVPWKDGEKNKDEFYIVHKLENRTTDVLAGSENQTRTFHHMFGVAPRYTCSPGMSSKTTWKEHKSREQLTLREGEWVVCIPREEGV